MLELAKYIYSNYPNIRNQAQYWQLLSLLDKNQDKIVVVKDGNNLVGSALYARISNETLWKIEYGFIDLKNPVSVQEILNDKGKNIHFLYVLADGQKTIRRGLREVIEKECPNTVSWYNPEMTKFNKFTLKGRVKLCLS